VFAAGADHAGGAYSALTNPLTGLRGFTSKGRGEERGKKGRGRGRMEGECLTIAGGIKGPVSHRRLKTEKCANIRTIKCSASPGPLVGFTGKGARGMDADMER